MVVWSRLRLSLELWCFLCMMKYVIVYMFLLLKGFFVVVVMMWVCSMCV